MNRPALFVPAITQYVSEGREAVQALRDADANIEKLEKHLVIGREAAQMRRIELGRILIRARDTMPRRGRSREDGWRAYLEAIEVGPTSAWRYMKEAGAVFQEGEVERMGIQPSETSPEPQPDAPPPTDEDAPVDEQAPAPEVEIDRDTWCTPRWITDAIGMWDLDPCANERSHVQAVYSYQLERGEDGLALVTKRWMKGESVRVFINPPYSDVMPWVQTFKHTRFCFLLKLDPSTKWFAELFASTELILIPRGTRIQFEAPAGVPPELAMANQFPHALFYARAEDATDAIKALCFPGWTINR